MTSPASPEQNLLLTAALAYAELGWRVLPLHSVDRGGCSCGRRGCASPAKHPRTRHGLKDASTDERQIKSWWGEWPDANVGVCCGAVNQADDGQAEWLLALDVDARHGGLESLASLEAKHGALPDSVRARTGGGGLHILLSSQAAIGNSASRLAPGLDVRGEGGYIVAPPSRHASGQLYGWEETCNPTCALVAPAPAWLLELLSKPRDAAPPQGSAPDKIVAGGRNDHLFRMGCAMRARGSTEATILAALRAENGERCVPPLREPELEDIARSCARYAPTQAKSAASRPAPRQASDQRPASEPAQASAQVNPETGEVFDDWTARLQQSRSGIANTLGNALTILAHDEAWKGVLAYDEFADQLVMLRRPPFEADYAGPHGAASGPRSPQQPPAALGAQQPPAALGAQQPPAAPGAQQTYPREITDDDLTRVAVWLERGWHVRIGSQVCRQAVDAACRARSVHPVREYLSGLRWDREPRLAYWLERYLGAETTDYVRRVAQWVLIAAVARIFRPGCKADHMLILEGAQGRGKSTALRVLAEPWFTDELPDLSNKDSRQQLRGIWLCELAELDAHSRAEVSTTKKFLAQSIDRYRATYAARPVNVPRQCIFIGTVNEAEYLRDSTGNRRFWPVRVGDVQLEELRRDRDQLWAEAVCAFRAGQPWWPTDAEEVAGCEAEQEQRYQADAWETAIAAFLALRVARHGEAQGWEDYQPVTVGQLLKDALRLPADRWDRQSQTRVGKALERLGWVRGARVQIDGVRLWPWFGPGTPREVTHSHRGIDAVRVGLSGWLRVASRREEQADA